MIWDPASIQTCQVINQMKWHDVEVSLLLTWIEYISLAGKVFLAGNWSYHNIANSSTVGGWLWPTISASDSEVQLQV